MSVEILQIIVYGEKLEEKETKETRRGQKKKKNNMYIWSPDVKERLEQKRYIQG